MSIPGDLSSKKIKNTYKAIVQYSDSNHRIYDGTGSRINDLDVTRITASKASLASIQDLQHLSAARVQISEHLSVTGSTFLGDDCSTDQVKVVGNTWITGSLTVSGSCQGSFRSIGQAKFIYLDNPSIEDQKPARVTRGMIRGQYNVPRFGGENAALDVYGNAVISGSLIVQDTVFAQEFHTEHVSSSIIYTSGSTKFGGDFNDTMQVTGSIFQSGSDSYFLNGIGLGVTGSMKPGVYDEPGQDRAINLSHLLTIEDPGHDALQYKKGKLVYGAWGTPWVSTHISASDTVRFRDSGIGDDVFVVSAVSKSVFFTTNDKYNVGIGVPSGSNSKVDENLVISGSTNTRVKIESATAATSASLYLESGLDTWEIAVASASTGTGNALSGSLVFRHNLSKFGKNTFGAASDYFEAFRIDPYGKVGVQLPSQDKYNYPREFNVSGSINIIQGRSVDISAGTFHDSDNTNGIYFNNQKMIYVSGSGAATSMFFGVAAGGVATATDGHANIGFGYQSGMSLTSGHRNVLIGDNAGKAVSTGDANVFIGEAAGLKATTAENCIAIGTGALYNTVAGAQSNIAIGHMAIKTGVATGDYNTAIGTLALEDLTTGADNVAIGSSAALNLTTATNTIAIGHDVMSAGVVVGNNNIAIGQLSGNDITEAANNILIGTKAGGGLTVATYNIAIGLESLNGNGDSTRNIAVGYHSMRLGNVTGDDNIGIGTETLHDLTSGKDNIAIGSGSAGNITTGDRNISIGSATMDTGVIVGDNNIGVGSYTLRDLSSGTDNISVGLAAASNLTTGISNISIGSGSMALGAVTGRDNISVGSFAMEDITAGSNNIAVGSGSSAAMTTNIGNIALGFESLKSSANGASYNVVVGYQAVATGDLSGVSNVIIGKEAGLNATAANNNVIIGRAAAGLGITTGGFNVVIGRYAGFDLTSGASNVFLGDATGFNATVASDNIAIGNQSFYNSVGTGQTVSNIAIGFKSMNTSAVVGYRNTAIGARTLDNLTTGLDNIAVGSSAGQGLTTGKDNIAIGSGSLHNATNIGSGNIGIGKESLHSITEGKHNIAIGSGSLGSSLTAMYSIAVGYNAMSGSNDESNYNIAIGYEAIRTGDVTGVNNIAIGSKTLDKLTTGSHNIAIGSGSMMNGVVTGDFNVAIGVSALESVTVGSGSVAIGHKAASNQTTGEANIAIGTGSMGVGIVSHRDGNNVAIGSFTLEDLTTGTDNVAIGNKAGFNITTATNTIAIGQDAMSAGVVTGADNIAIGRDALLAAVGASNNIAIGMKALAVTTNTAAGNIAIGDGAAHEGIVTGTNNVILGSEAAAVATSLDANVIIGYKAAHEGVVTGDKNIIMGASASAILTSGVSNIVIGTDAGNLITTNQTNILLGSGSTAAATINNAYAIGTLASVTTGNSLVLGGQTGERFTIGMGGITAPNATLEVSGTANFTGSALFSGSHVNGPGHDGYTLKTIGTTVMSGTMNTAGTYRQMRALEVSGTTNFRGNMYITGNLIVSDIVIAQEFHTEFVSASIAFSSGSNKMGNSNDDQQQMTGSLRVSGSGPHYFVGRRIGNVMPGTDNAKVGINTINPTYELDVAGNLGVGSGSHSDVNQYSYIYHNADEDTHWKLSKDTSEFSAGGYTLGISGSLDANNEVIVNEGAKKMNFRVESANADPGAHHNDEHLLFVSGGALINEGWPEIQQHGAVGIRCSNPTKALTVSGSISASGNLYLHGDISVRNITSSGNISASNLFATHSFGGRTSFIGNVTASGNISASQLLVATTIRSSGSISTKLHITASGNISGSGTLDITGNVNFDGDLDVDGTTNLDAVDIDGNTQADGTLTVGVDGTGHDVVFFGATAGQFLRWRQASDELVLAGDSKLSFNDSGNSDNIVASAAGHLEVNAGATLDMTAPTVDINASTEVKIGGNVNLYGHFSASGNITASGNISASGIIYTDELSQGFATTGLTLTGNVTASSNISASGYVSASNFIGLSGSFLNIQVTGSGTAAGTGSFGRIDVNHIVIHNHETIGGQGLTVNGAETNLGTAGDLTHIIRHYGHVSASGNVGIVGNLTVTGSISGSSLSVNSLHIANDLTVSGSISGSWISASNGIWTSGSLWVGGQVYATGSLTLGGPTSTHTIKGNITSSGNISSSGIIYAADYYDNQVNINTIYAPIVSPTFIGNLSASNIYSAGDVSGSHISASKEIYSAGHITASGDISASGDVYGTNLYAAAGVMHDNDANTGVVFVADTVQILTNNIQAAAFSTTYGQRIGNVTYPTNITGSTISLTGNITSSGNISASTIIASHNVVSSGSIVSRNYRSFYVAAAGMTPSITAGASAATEEYTDSTFNTYDHLAFDGNGATEHANFQIPMPYEWDRGTVSARFYWHSNAGTLNSRVVVWGINASEVTHNLDLDTVQNTWNQVASAVIDDDQKLIISDPVTVTVANANANWATGSLSTFRVNRESSHAQDTYLGDSRLLGIEVQYRERAAAEGSWGAGQNI